MYVVSVCVCVYVVSVCVCVGMFEQYAIYVYTPFKLFSKIILPSLITSFSSLIIIPISHSSLSTLYIVKLLDAL